MVSVDTVYQRVLALANKEQRGYITPQEFNLLANQSQMEIFEEYFHHLNQYLRNPGNDSSYSDSVDYIQDKISRFLVDSDTINFTEAKTNGHVLPNSSLMYRLTRVSAGTDVLSPTAQQVTFKDFKNQARAVYAAQAHDNSPIYVRMFNDSAGGPAFTDDNVNLIKVYINSSQQFTGTISIGYIRVPNKVNWDYVVVNEKALYNANGASNFDLHPSEETNLVYRILMLSGITINKPGLASLAKAEVAEQSNNEKS